MVQVSNFLTHAPENDGPLKIFAEMIKKHILSTIFGKFKDDESYLLVGKDNFD